MSRTARLATSLLAVAAILAIGVLVAAGATGGPPATVTSACGSATDSAYDSTALAAVLRIARGERNGNAVRRAIHTIETNKALLRAVSARDAAATRRAVVALVFNHMHIVRLRVSAAGRVLSDIGGPHVLAPVQGTLRSGGRVIGTFTMSLQDDLGYQLLISRLVGQHSVMSFSGKLITRDIAADPATLPSFGTTLIGGVSYLVHSFYVGHFPRGRLRVWLLVRAPAKRLERRPCAQVRADEAAAIARLAYSRASTGTAVEKARTALSNEHQLPLALAAGDYAGASTLVTALIRQGGFGGLRILIGGHLVAAGGGTAPLISPVHATVLGAGGVVVARAVLAVQDASGFAYLAHYLTGDPVLVRSGSKQLGGTFPGPAVVPRSGRVSYRGVYYRVASFAGVRYPSGALRVYVLAAG
ncbi:MAG TPA: hypothetical protein VHX66_16180 [Solirubrobacteraceae bacterium]|jgi:hypothetical protein|nr:hypothetical protein [Solirubrobacteraceae bacterium]